MIDLDATIPWVTMGLLMTGAVGALAAAFRLMRFPDVTVEGSFLIGGAVWSALISAGAPTPLASLAALLAGAACGTATAILIHRFRVDRFLAGILVSTSAYSVALWSLGKSNVGLFGAPGVFIDPADFQSNTLALALGFALTVVLALLLFFHSSAGVRARAAAINPSFLEAVGGNAAVGLGLGLAMTNTLAAASGLVVARYQGFVDVGMGQGVLITALASFAIGEAVARWISTSLVLHTALATLVGSILYQGALALALAAGIPPASTKVATAGFVLLFLILQYRRQPEVEAAS
jgi:putative ABC transport system permease protein